MKKLVIISLMSSFFLAGCQFLSFASLDTSSLTEVNDGDGFDGITYEAPTLEEGLKALPFDLTLPEELPFEAEPFSPPVINDLKGDGKMLIADFGTRSLIEKEEIALRVKVEYPISDSSFPDYEEVELSDGVKGYYLKSGLSFQIGNVLHTLVYMNDTIPVEQHKEEIIKMANQMIK